MVGQVDAFLNLVRRALPNLFQSFESIRKNFFTKDEDQAVLDLYLRIPSTSFSHDVLTVCPHDLAVLSSKTLAWTDEVNRALSLIGCKSVESERTYEIGAAQTAAR
jgi:hypothetical protein